MGKLIKKHRWSIILAILGISAIVIFNFSSNEGKDVQETSYMPARTFEMMPLLWITGIVGGCIAITLTYVSWKKFRAQRRKKAD
ncbi:sporulation protein YpjB [Aciduricibacillus chroicocephali]|uniref:Sporulation protein YpjB n=1 Tax=Aciduricibacillus chroicocephali TaxID=3054939 RepID=A0ABY9KRU4_9BACI|nr:sporulation protein YpjB [Bacillaceae bacterium 44XB]